MRILQGINLNKILFILIWIVFFSSCDRISKKYDAFADVLAAGDNDRGWLPPFITDEKYGMFDTVSKIKEVHDLDTNKIWGQCNVTRELMDEFEIFFLQNTEVKLVFKDQQDEFRRINFENLTFFVDANSGPYWYYALDKTKTILYFFSEHREYYYNYDKKR
jgi:hypothetical protein